MSSLLKLYLDCIVFIFGAVIGSFLNVCIHRMPRDQSVVTPPSHCPKCKKQIGWRDNIPLMSYLALRGRCRMCGEKFSPRYFFVELLTGILFLWVWLRFTDWTIPVLWVLVAGLIVATCIDFEHYIIPNEITLGGVVVGLLLSALHPATFNALTRPWAIVWSLVGAVAGGATLLAVAMIGEQIFKKEAMGMGDVKFLAAIGAFLGWQATLFTVFISSMVGGVVGLTLVVMSKRNWQARIPYGPYIAFGAVVWIFFGPELVNWYLSFLKG